MSTRKATTLTEAIINLQYLVKMGGQHSSPIERQKKANSEWERFRHMTSRSSRLSKTRKAQQTEE